MQGGPYYPSLTLGVVPVTFGSTANQPEISQCTENGRGEMKRAWISDNFELLFLEVLVLIFTLRS